LSLASTPNWSERPGLDKRYHREYWMPVPCPVFILASLESGSIGLLPYGLRKLNLLVFELVQNL